jgi:hypothetical protein
MAYKYFLGRRHAKREIPTKILNIKKLSITYIKIKKLPKMRETGDNADR